MADYQAEIVRSSCCLCNLTHASKASLPKGTTEGKIVLCTS